LLHGQKEAVDCVVKKGETDLEIKMFAGKIALVTGATAGMGRATALAFAREGARVVMAARREERGQDVVEQIARAGGESLFVKTDVRNPADVDALFQTIMDRYGRLDFAFNNAGVSTSHNPTVIKYDDAEWDRVLETNLRGVWLCMKHEIDIMKKQGGGVIVNTASILGVVGDWGLSSYCASKHGSLEMAKTAALEYCKDNIRINTICPGPIITEMLEKALPFMPTMLEVMAGKTAVRRVGRPEEIAGAVLWLCTDEAGFMIGKEIAIDGGYITY
jgi:NAD(P)-dependent dehydrogenase (short-subunit alcohol dehydrogenase family)